MFDPAATTNLLNALRYYWIDLADPRTRDWPIVGSPWTIPALTILYLAFVLHYGPRYMTNRRPYSLKAFIKCYDVFQIVANSLVVYNIFVATWYTDLSIFCEPVVYSYEPTPYKLAQLMWWVMLLKLVDYVETVVFVLRNKRNQVSLLHVYHHISTVTLQWYTTRYVAGSMACFVHVVNCSVHVIMYTYYFLSSFGPSVQKYVFKVKPAITIIQMAQFWVLMLYGLQALRPSCDVPKAPIVFVILDLALNFALFFNFYQQTYSEKPRRE